MTDTKHQIKADLVVAHGYVVTMDEGRRIFTDGAVAIAGRDIVAVGPTADVLQEPKFALMVAVDAGAESSGRRDVFADSYNVLRSLGHSEADSRKLLEPFLQGKKKFTDVDQIIQEIYARQRQGSA